MNNMNVSKAGISKKMDIRMLVSCAMLGAVAIVLMLFEFPLWFAPPFYQLDFSEVPVLVGAFVFGPMAGILIELLKILLNFMINGTITAGVGELANFIIGCAFIVPAAYIYKKKKSRKSAILSMAVGIIVMVIVGCIINAYVLLPAYASAFGPTVEGLSALDGLIAAGTAINPAIKNMSTFILLGVAPFNLVKGILVSLVTICLYKKLSVIFKKNH